MIYLCFVRYAVTLCKQLRIMVLGAKNFRTSALRQTASMLEERAVHPTTRMLDEMMTIVIPTLNEESGIAKVIDELHSLGLCNILVVDGYSQDRTVEVSTRLGAKTIFQQGQGKTGALLTAIDSVSTPYMLVMDGDYTYDANYIARLASFMNSYDQVIGARIPVSNLSMTGLHKFGNAVITSIFNALMGTNLSDVCSGMYIIKTSVANQLQLVSSGFDLEAEIAAKVASMGSLTEVGINN